MSGKIKIFIGCMYSGKSTELIKIVNRYTSINKKILGISHSLDTRSDVFNTICSHDKLKINCIKVSSLTAIPIADIIEYEIIVIDEAQFFNDLIQFCIPLVEKYNKTLIVAGLDGTFERKPFKNNQLLELIPFADSVKKLNAYCQICKDGTRAPFSLKLSRDKTEIDIGSNDKYIAVCRKHYLELSCSHV